MSEIREAATLEEANRFLAQGFVLVKVMERMVYVMGLPRDTKETPPQGDGKNGKAAAQSPNCLNALSWKKFSNGKGEWAFFLGPDDALLPELEPAREFIESLKQEKEASLDGWRYRISKERFLNRFPAQKEVK
jgi:hypothetical protein